MSLEQYEIQMEFKASEKTQIFLATNKENNEKVVVKKYFYETEVSKFQPLLKKPHKNMANVLEYGKYENGFYIVEEFIDGATIEEMLLGGKVFTKKEVYQIAIQICSVLKYLHSLNIVYRDLKPANIMLTLEDTIKLIDFNTIRIYNLEGDKDTQHLGTIGYAPPEQYGFSQTDFRSDIYSFGVTIGAITGNSRAYGNIIKKCTNVDSDKRYKNVDSLLKAIELAQLKSKPVLMPLVAIAIISICFIITKATEYINLSTVEEDIKYTEDNTVVENIDVTEDIVVEDEIEPTQDIIVEDEIEPTEDIVVEDGIEPIEDIVIEDEIEPIEDIVVENNVEPTQDIKVEEEVVEKKEFPNLEEFDVSHSGFLALRSNDAVNDTLMEISGYYYDYLMDDYYTGQAYSIHNGMGVYTVLTPFSAWEIWEDGNMRITWIRYDDYPYFTKKIFTTPNFNDETAYSQQWLKELHQSTEETLAIYEEMKKYME